MARETFLHNLQTAAYSVDRRAEIDSPHLSADELTQLQSRCDRWLTPKTVEDFAPEDFPELSSQKRHELQQEVKGFLAVARSVPADAPATKKQVKEAFAHIQRLIGLVRGAVLLEWRQALERLFKEVEDWCAEENWAVQRNAKQISDTLLGEYEVPSILIHTKENVRYLITPTARFIAGGTGRVDMCLWPSFNDVGIVRVDDSWYVVPLRGAERRKRWSRDAFLNLAAQLAKAA